MIRVYISISMKQPVHPQILVIQKISAVLIHGRYVEPMLEKVLEIIDTPKTNDNKESPQ